MTKGKFMKTKEAKKEVTQLVRRIVDRDDEVKRINSSTTAIEVWQNMAIANCVPLIPIMPDLGGSPLDLATNALPVGRIGNNVKPKYLKLGYTIYPNAQRPESGRCGYFCDMYVFSVKPKGDYIRTPLDPNDLTRFLWDSSQVNPSGVVTTQYIGRAGDYHRSHYEDYFTLHFKKRHHITNFLIKTDGSGLVEHYQQSQLVPAVSGTIDCTKYIPKIFRYTDTDSIYPCNSAPYVVFVFTDAEYPTASTPPQDGTPYLYANTLVEMGYTDN